MKLRQAMADAEKIRRDMQSWMRTIGKEKQDNFNRMLDLLKQREETEAELQGLEEARGIMKKNLRLILKKPDRKTTHTRQARQIEWLQSFIEGYTWIPKLLGPKARSVRALYNEFATDPDFRRRMQNKLGQGAYTRVAGIVFKNEKTSELRPYGDLSKHDRMTLFRLLSSNENIFEELGIDVNEPPPVISAERAAAIEAELRDRFPPGLLEKLKGLAEKDADGMPATSLADMCLEDLQSLAGIINQLRKEGRADYQARREARKQLIAEEQQQFLAQIRKFLPEKAVQKIGAALPGSGAESLREEKRGWRHIAYALLNARRFFRMLEGGEDDVLYYAITRREYAAFDQENSRVFARHKEVEQRLDAAGITLKDLGKTTFEVEMLNEATGKIEKAPLTLDEMLSVYYAQYNDRAFHAVAFGNFATQGERDALRDMNKSTGYSAEGLTPEALLAQTELEAKITARYWKVVKQLDDFFVKEGNEKYRAVMEIIGRDFDENYGRLRDFIADEYNMELGSEPYYMPLQRTSIMAQENNDVEAALAEHGLSRYINKGFSKNRIEIAPANQQAVRLGFYALWDNMVAKQEHLMAYDGLMREMKQVFEGHGSEALRGAIKQGHGDAGVKYVKTFVSELAKPTSQHDSEALNRLTRLVRGHYSAAVLGWRLSSILKQAVQSPPPFFLYVTPAEYYAAMASCLKEDTRDFIKERSVYLKARYFDPAAATVEEMKRLTLQGRLGNMEAVQTRIEQTGMKGQEWIDAVAVMPGWLAAYKRKLAELNRTMGQDTAAPGVTPKQLQAMAVMNRDARTLTEAESIVKDAEKGFINKPITNKKFNITATVSRNSLDEMTNPKQLAKAVSPRLQAKAVANADTLLERAVEHITHKDTHNRAEVEQVHRFGSVMEDGNGGYVPVKITVIEYKKTNEGKRLYTIEAVDVEKIKSAGLMVPHLNDSDMNTPIADFDTRLVQLAEKVNNNMDLSAAEYEAAAYADQVVRDCQPSSVAMDQMPLLRDLKRHPLGGALAAFQTPMAVIFQNLVFDAPTDIGQGIKRKDMPMGWRAQRVLHGLWTYALYAGLAAMTVALFEGFGGDDDDDDKPLAGKIGFAAAMGLVESIPVLGGDLAFQAENFYRTGKLRVYFGGGNVPAADNLARAVNAISEADWQKALLRSGEALGYMTGLPAQLVDNPRQAL